MSKINKQKCEYSNVQIFKSANVQMFQCANVHNFRNLRALLSLSTELKPHCRNKMDQSSNTPTAHKHQGTRRHTNLCVHSTRITWIYCYNAVQKWKLTGFVNANVWLAKKKFPTAARHSLLSHCAFPTWLFEVVH